MRHRHRSPSYYAVTHGRYGPSIYLTWQECKKAVFRLSNNMYRRFSSMCDARRWLEETLSIRRFKPVEAPQELLGHINSSLMCCLEDRATEQPHAIGPSVAHSGVYNATSFSNILSETSDHEDTTSDTTLVDSIVDEEMTFTDIRLDTFIPNLLQIDDSSVAPAVECPPEQPPDAGLSDEQRRIFRTAQAGRNIFFTGSAGVGKSVLTRAIIRYFLGVYREDEVAITATTGIAAQNIGGRTIHSFAGCGCGRPSAEELAERIENNKFSRKRWKDVRVLILDEVSMLGGDLLDKLDYVARDIRKKKLEAFGGIQLIFSGDFFQLPPIGKKITDKSGARLQVPPIFAFDSEIWSICFGKPMMLTQVFRQQDEHFASVPNTLRTGQWSTEVVQFIKALSRPLKYNDGIDPVYLFSTKEEVKRMNDRKLIRLKVCGKTFNAVDSGGTFPDGTRLPFRLAEEILEREVLAEKRIWLKVGAQVMLLKNIEQGRLVNGSLGKIVEFVDVGEANKRGVDIAKLPPTSDDGKLSLEELRDLERKRKRRGKDRLREMTENMFTAKTVWPLVRFTNGLHLLCAPLEFEVEGVAGNLEARRLQVPLMLSWAITVHKSQGQSIDRLCVDLTRTFECGQAYVALSRATKVETLEVRGFDPSKVKLNQRVLTWTSEWMDEQEWRFTYGDDRPFPRRTIQ